MSATQRIGAVVRADVLIRLRRPSTLVMFLLLSAIPYLWIPDPAKTGRALMQINGQRVLYNSAAIGMATALLGSLFIGLIGFYVVSNAVRRDARSRCGFVLAATPLGSGEYIVGKFLGNVLFLTTFLSGYMLTAMGMQVVRGEAPLQPFTFMKQYVLMTPAAIVFVAALAITFESIPFLAGRFGDVLYFFMWVMSLAVIGSSMEHGAPWWVGCFDICGIGMLGAQLHSVSGHGMAIGSSTFNPARGIYIFNGLSAHGIYGLQRVVATFAALPLLAVARLAFHRFDPVRVKNAGPRQRTGWLGVVNRWSRPLARLFAPMLRPSSTVAGAARVDAWLTFASQPFIAVAVIFVAVLTASTPLRTIGQGALPVAFLIAGVCISDVASREARAGTLSLAYVAPRLREQFVAWKLLSALLVTLAFLIVPIVRFAIANPRALPPLLAGALFVSAAATALGVLSRNPKTFLLLFLMFWYFVMNDKGATPSVDFANFFGVTTPLIVLGYVAATIALFAAAEVRHRVTLAA
jgi:hypothetical protein